jgi:septal ring factor EnvC (AmiA/AmiB activator)
MPMAIDEIQKENFFKLLDQIRSQADHLKKKNRELSRENARLRSKLDEVHKEQTDIFSSISESERLAMRHQVSGLIEKIDKYLEDE